MDHAVSVAWHVSWMAAGITTAMMTVITLQACINLPIAPE